MRRRSQGERVELPWFECGASQTDPLTGEVFEVRRTVEFYFDDVGGQEFGFEDVERDVLGAEADHFVQGEDDARTDEEDPEPRSSC